MTSEEAPDVSIDVEFESSPTADGRMLVSAIGQSVQGKRNQNEDAYRVVNEELFIVADGMGGHEAGEVASQLAVDVVTAAFETDHFGGIPDENLPRFGDELVRAIKTANEVIFDRAQQFPEHSGMGTTIVAVRFSPDRGRAYVAHVGDSRCYRLRGERITQLTRDHTLGLLGVDGPEKNRLVRAVGIDAKLNVDLQVDLVERGDVFLLCTDGLCKMVPDQDIHQLVQEDSDPVAAVRRLVEEANARGGRDDVTAIIVRVDQA